MTILNPRVNILQII